MVRYSDILRQAMINETRLENPALADTLSREMDEKKAILQKHESERKQIDIYTQHKAAPVRKKINNTPEGMVSTNDLLKEDSASEIFFGSDAINFDASDLDKIIEKTTATSEESREEIQQNRLSRNQMFEIIDDAISSMDGPEKQLPNPPVDETPAPAVQPAETTLDPLNESMEISQIDDLLGSLATDENLPPPTPIAELEDFNQRENASKDNFDLPKLDEIVKLDDAVIPNEKDLSTPEPVEDDLDKLFAELSEVETPSEKNIPVETPTENPVQAESTPTPIAAAPTPDYAPADFHNSSELGTNKAVQSDGIFEKESSKDILDDIISNVKNGKMDGEKREIDLADLLSDDTSTNASADTLEKLFDSPPETTPEEVKKQETPDTDMDDMIAELADSAVLDTGNNDQEASKIDDLLNNMSNSSDSINAEAVDTPKKSKLEMDLDASASIEDLMSSMGSTPADVVDNAAETDSPKESEEKKSLENSASIEDLMESIGDMSAEIIPPPADDPSKSKLEIDLDASASIENLMKEISSDFKET